MSPRDGPALQLRLAWILVLLVHVVLAGLALGFLPHGFPIFHPRSVLGTLAPSCAVAISLTLSVVLVFAPRAGARFVPAIPAFYGSVALGLLLVFPETGPVAARSLGLVALLLAVLAVFTCRGCAILELMPGVLLGAASGQLLARCERPSPPSTQPSREAAPWRADGPRTRPPARLEIAPGLVIEGSERRVTWKAGQWSISIAPGLEFDRTPPDGFWSIFAGDAGRAPSVAVATTPDDAVRLWSSDEAQRLQVQRDSSTFGPGTRVVRLDAWTLLDRPVYSHLNSFTTVQFSGHRRLGLRFSPCPSALLAVTHADYPTGAPARFAYVDAARKFRVVQATDAEKGPFTTLAEGRLALDATLSIDFVDIGEPAQPFARIEFVDFARELSTALSPTAGYGVAENAIEFGLAEADASSPAHLVLTLAASGIGRGWDSVGHRAGAYRNRVILSSLELPPAPDPVLRRDLGPGWPGQ